MMCDTVAPIGDTSDVYRMTFAFKKPPQTLFVIFRQVPISSPIVSRTAGHQTYLDSGALLCAYLRTHDAVHSLAQRAVAAQDQYLVVAFFRQLAGQLYCVVCIFRHTIRKRLMPFSEQTPQIDALCAEGSFAGFGIDNYS